MAEPRIFVSDNSERTQFESESRGFRGDVFVKIKDLFFQINVYDIVRLTQDYNREIKLCGFYYMEPNLVLVELVDNNTIKNTIMSLYNKSNYFEALKPISLSDENYATLYEL